MPTGRETVVNKALSGEELKTIILADAKRLVDAEGMLSPHIAFGRVSYSLSLKLHVDNPYVPDTLIEILSKKDNGVPQQETFPLADPSPMAEAGAMTLDRAIDSPNAERLREGMGIPVLTRQQDSTTQMETITYPKDAFPDLPPGDLIIKDATEAMRAQYGLVEPETQPTPSDANHDAEAPAA